MNRRAFLKQAGFAAGLAAAWPMANAASSNDITLDFPVWDLHVHQASGFSITDILDLGRKRDVRFGIVEHPAPGVLKSDADLRKYIDSLRKHPVLVGLQPMHPGWSKRFSPELLAEVDYVLMDPQTIPLGDGKFMYIWQFDTYVEDAEEFMRRYMAHSLEILNNEPINIFGWPLFLPVCIARDYYALWTEERMQQLISAAKARNIAFEINDMSHTPHEKFIRMAKAQGLKFTFGSDARNSNAGRLSYCRRIAAQCGLKADDFYLPKRKST